MEEDSGGHEKSNRTELLLNVSIQRSVKLFLLQTRGVETASLGKLSAFKSNANCFPFESWFENLFVSFCLFSNLDLVTKHMTVAEGTQD